MKEQIRLCAQCEGCGLCSNICLQDAITLVPDANGFYKPKVEPIKCIRCGKCMKACSQKKLEGSIPLHVFAAKHTEKSVIMNSSSGGLFTAVSDLLLSNNGSVYGVVFNAQFGVEHTRATTQSDRDRMRGSKYVQSNIGYTMRQIHHDLQDGTHVLFTGTPCQIDALNTYLRMANANTERLVTCEVICNGVSSPELWRRYVEEYLGLKRIQKIWFRFKHPKIHGSIFAVQNKYGWLNLSGYYSQLYTSKNCYNEACYHCKYTERKRYSDLSIGDFQGRSDTPVKLDPTNGLSVILVNTEKGKMVWDKIAKCLDWQEINQNYVQERLLAPCNQPDTYHQFWEDVHKMPMTRLLKKYTQKSLLEDLRAVKLGLRINR